MNEQCGKCDSGLRYRALDDGSDLKNKDSCDDDSVITSR